MLSTTLQFPNTQFFPSGLAFCIFLFGTPSHGFTLETCVTCRRNGWCGWRTTLRAHSSVSSRQSGLPAHRTRLFLLFDNSQSSLLNGSTGLLSAGSMWVEISGSFSTGFATALPTRIRWGAFFRCPFSPFFLFSPFLWRLAFCTILLIVGILLDRSDWQ